MQLSSGICCKFMCRLSLFLKQRPPSASEYRPLNGLDITTLAEVCLISVIDCLRRYTKLLTRDPSIFLQLALKDAEKLVNLQNTVKSYMLKATAFSLVCIHILASSWCTYSA